MLSNPVFRLLCVSFLAWMAIFYSSIMSAVAIWMRSETFTHCFIILPICIYIIRLKWPQIRLAKVQPNLWVLVIIFGVLVLWLLGNLAKFLIIEQIGAFLMLPLMIWLLLGNQVAKMLIFPCAFWMFSVPFGEVLVPQMQELTADITVWLLQLTGVPVYRDGLYLTIPSGLFEVAEACSGVRYLIASFTIGSLFAYLNYQSYKKRLIFIIFSLVLPLIANGIRAYGIVMIAYASDMKYATGVDHLIYGWLFFAFVIFVMFTVGSIWSDPAPKLEVSDAPNSSVSIPVKSYAISVAMLAILLGLGLTYKSQVQNPISQYELQSNEVFNDQSKVLSQTWSPQFKNVSSENYGSQDGIDYYLAFYNSDKPDQEMISSLNKLYNTEYWSKLSTRSYESFDTISIVNLYGQKRMIAYTYITEWIISPKTIKVKLIQAIQAILGQPQIGIVLVMSVPLEDDHDQGERLIESAKLKMAIELKDYLNAK